MCVRIKCIELRVFSLKPGPWKVPVIVMDGFIIPIADEEAHTQEDKWFAQVFFSFQNRSL